MPVPQYLYWWPRCSYVIREANRVRMGEGREDRTQIEDVITIPKTDHKVGTIHVKRVHKSKDSLHPRITGPIPGSSVSNTGPVRQVHEA